MDHLDLDQEKMNSLTDGVPSSHEKVTVFPNEERMFIWIFDSATHSPCVVLRGNHDPGGP